MRDSLVSASRILPLSLSRFTTANYRQSDSSTAVSRYTDSLSNRSLSHLPICQINQLLCERASSSATLSSAASKWSCKLCPPTLALESPPVEDQIGRLGKGLNETGADEICSDILHPNRANISKDELRAKLAELYKANKDQVNVFGLQTQFGGGKTTGFALIYDSPEALKKFEPHYRLVRVGFASKIEKASRQQRMFDSIRTLQRCGRDGTDELYRQTAQKQTEDSPRYGKGQGCDQEEGQIDHSSLGVRGGWRKVLVGFCDGHCLYALAPINPIRGCIRERPLRIVAYSIEPFGV